MEGSVTVHFAAPADKIWNLITDITRTGEFSPEVFESEWLGGATGPALGAKFRGHVRRNEIGPVYWTTCQVTACEPGREFGFAVLAGDRALNNWHYRLDAQGDGTDVTESFRLANAAPMRVFWLFGGYLRGRRNRRDMRTTLERMKKVVEND
jgi:hypothetical protein